MMVQRFNSSILLRSSHALLRMTRRKATSPPVRNMMFSEISKKDLDTFREVLGAGRVMVRGEGNEETDLRINNHNRDWMGRWEGNSSVVLFPETTEEVSDVLRYCNERRIGVTPQGGNTGLVGGSIPVHDEVILSLSKMNNIIEFDDETGCVIAEAGCILEILDDYVGRKGYLMVRSLSISHIYTHTHTHIHTAS